MTPRRLAVLKVLVFGACLAPLALLVMKAAGIASLSFGANPVEDVLDTCGKTGLNLLMLTLCVTPIRRATGFNRLVAFRRMLGLFAFFYVLLHFTTYALLDLGLAWETLLLDIAMRPYITVGFTALVLLVPLAVTSTNGFQRRLGRNWVKLHRLVYPIAALGLIHYWWQIKSKADIADPLLYAFLLAVLLGVRFAHWRALRRKRAQSVDSKTAVAPTYQRVEPP
jgi:sulfoxide reductase heme-binding subunit YedZ